MSRRISKNTFAVTVKLLPILILLSNLTSIYAIPGGAETPWNKIEPGNIGDVNLFNGTLNMTIPLLDVRGRGDVRIPVNLRLTENNWRKWLYWYYDPESPFPYSCSIKVLGEDFQSLECQGATNPEPDNKWIYPTFDSDVNLGYMPGKLVGRTQTFEMKVCTMCADGGTSCGLRDAKRSKSRFTLSFYSPDGSSHELIDKATLGTILEDTEFSCSLHSQMASRGTEFVSNDGSGMTFISDTAFSGLDPQTTDQYGNSYPVAVSGVLHTANGFTYRIDDGNITLIKDQNGNLTAFTYYGSGNPANGKLNTITDSLGRTVTFEYDVQDQTPYGLCDRITYKGFGGIDRIIRISKTNLANVLISGQTIKTAGELFPATCHGQQNGACASNQVNPIVASELWLPDGKSYKFKYTSFVEVARVELPAGSAVEFDYDYSVPNASNYEYYTLSREVKEKRVYLDSTNPNSLVSKTKYLRPTYTSTPLTIDQTDANDNLINRTVSYFYGDPQNRVLDSQDNNIPGWQEGLNYRTDYYASDGTTQLRRVLSDWKNKDFPGHSSVPSDPSYDTRLTKQVFVTIENDKALAVLKTSEYDENGNSDPAYFSHLNLKKSKAYNYEVLSLTTAQNADLSTIAALFSESDLASVTETDFLYNAGYKDRHILGLRTETRELNPTNQTDVLAKSQVLFDEQGQYYSMDDKGSTTGYEVPTGSYSYLRGNPTTNRTWNKDTNTWIETHTQFDNFGNIRKAWDQSGDTTRFVETEYSSQHYYAYPTKTTVPAPDPTGTHGTTESPSITTTYDFWTGLNTSVTDWNNQITIFEYDNLLRPKKVIPPTGAAVTEKEYGDTPGNLYVKTRTQIDAQNWAESTSFMDNLGRVYMTQTKDLEGDIFTEIQLDDFGRIKQISTPYRQGDQKLWFKPRYDEKERAVELFAPAPEGQTGTSLGIVEYGISTISGFVGNYVTTTDASGRKSRKIKNVYGNIIRKDEPTGNNDPGPLDNPNQPSFYSYNSKGELIKIQQGQQNRYFMHDSFGRIIRIREPEKTPNPNLNTTGNPENNQWTNGYTYDNFGRVVTATDSNGTVATNDYDKAGRLITSSYNDGITPQDNYFYDGKGLPQIPQYAKGKLTKVSNSVSEHRFTSFDKFGRVLTSQQITDGETYEFGYKYDSVGDLIEQTYPSGRVVKTHHNIDGDLSAISSKIANGPYKTYLSNLDYDVAGKIKAMMLGNGRWETFNYNERSQLTQIGLGNSSTDSSLWKVNYDYGELNPTDGSVDASKNIGNIAKQTITMPTASFVQTYKYDELKRLVEAKEMAETVSGSENWKQTFDYDRYGNRIGRYQKIGTNVLPINDETLPQIDPENNRFTTGQGYVYDFNGNLIQDAENRGITYDGNNKQTEVRDLNIPTSPSNPDANVIGRYYYDTLGKRVKKVTNTETTVFVYDAGGVLVSEYSTQLNQEDPTTSYLTADKLGSPRIITDKTGNVISRRDFMPFGEELLAGVGARDVTNLKYSSDGIDNARQRFTGYQKDLETDLDFAEARMYQNNHGRFTAPDPLLASASPANPQTLNRYAYTGNNPVNLTDPSGLHWCKELNDPDHVKNMQKECESGWVSADGDTITLSQINSGFPGAKVNDTVLLKGDDSFIIISPSAQQEHTNESSNTGGSDGAATQSDGSTSQGPSEGSGGGPETVELPRGISPIQDPLNLLPLPAGDTKDEVSKFGILSPQNLVVGEIFRAIEESFGHDILHDGIRGSISFMGFSASITNTRDGDILGTIGFHPLAFIKNMFVDLPSAFKNGSKLFVPKASISGLWVFGGKHLSRKERVNILSGYFAEFEGGGGEYVGLDLSNPVGVSGPEGKNVPVVVVGYGYGLSLGTPSKTWHLGNLPLIRW